jgi:integrase
MAVDAFLKSLGKRASLPLASLTARDVENFLDARTAENLSPATLNLDVKIIGGALNVARRQGLIPTNPAEAVELPEIESAERGTFTPDEVKLPVDAAEGEWKLVIPLAYYTAARLGDCCRMQWDGLDLVGETLTYTQYQDGQESNRPASP